jgi:SM-20-related protein
MEKVFDALIDSFIENKIGISEFFLSKKLSTELSANLHTHFKQGNLTLAGTGTSAKINSTNLVRGDKIYWLDQSHDNKSENVFLGMMDALIIYLNRTCYTGITDYEFHYTLYETGTYYKKHIDQFTTNDRRKYSVIFYLNEDWQTEDGGELSLKINHQTVKINPTSGKCVFFKSNEIEHEVLVTHKNRLSITGWLKV